MQIITKKSSTYNALHQIVRLLGKQVIWMNINNNSSFFIVKQARVRSKHLRLRPQYTV